MTLETYSKATDLRVEINHLMDLRGVLMNSKGRILRCVKPDSLDVVNSVPIHDEPIIKKLVEVVDAEIRALEDEFHKL